VRNDFDNILNSLEFLRGTFGAENAGRPAKTIAEEVMGDHRPEVWVSDRYAGQQDVNGGAKPGQCGGVKPGQ
jgi:hypothetical protein